MSIKHLQNTKFYKKFAFSPHCTIPWAEQHSCSNNTSQKLLQIRQFQARLTQNIVPVITNKGNHSERQNLVGNGRLLTILFKNWTQRRQHYCVFHKFTNVMEVPAEVFGGRLDRFNGITVCSRDEFQLDLNFEQKLQKSLQYWIESKRRCIWFKVLTVHAEWIPILAKNGFEFHHAKSGFVLMYRWLPENETANLPPFAHTMIGVGGLVVNDKSEVLVVSDLNAMIPNSWKLPGGYVEPCENLIDAAIREVREETGVETEFTTVVSLRNSHAGAFGCSDLYVVIGLKALTSKLVRCEREIAKLTWMPIHEYLQHPNIHETNRHFLRTFLNYQKEGITFTSEQHRHQILDINYALYFVKPKTENNDSPEVQIRSKESSKSTSHM